jgi:hypothetical protein
METFACEQCGGIAVITTVKESDKATLPEIEFCPFCGMSACFSNVPKSHD